MQRRLLVLLAIIGLTAAFLSGPAGAHLGHEPIAQSADAETAARVAGDAAGETGPSVPSTLGTRSAPRHHAPPVAALLAGAVVLLAAIPHRRRTLALALALLLATVAFEGAFHAALHLRHLPHADGLAIGASSTQQAAADPEDAVPIAAALALLTEAPGHYKARVPDIDVATNHGRAPPLSPA